MNSMQVFTEKQIILLQKFVDNPAPSTLAVIQSFIEEQEDSIKDSQKCLDSMISIPLFPEHQAVISYMEKFKDDNKFLRIDQCTRIIENIGPVRISFNEFLFRCQKFSCVRNYAGKYQNFRVGHIGISVDAIHIFRPFFTHSMHFYSNVVDRFHFLNEIEEKYAYGNTLKLKGDK